MRIEKIHIQNFRGIEELEFNLNPNFNLFIGENGAGKTAILEAFAVGIGSFFSGMPGVPSRHIRREDIRYFKTPEGSYEFSDKTKIEVKGVLNNKNLLWYKERNGIWGSNIMGNRSPIRLESEAINKSIKDSKPTTFIDLPVLAYYSTARLWKEGRDNKKEEDNNDKVIRNIPSRYRGYKDALEIKSTFKIMLEWFKGKFKEMLVNKEPSFQLDCVRDVII